MTLLNLFFPRRCVSCSKFGQYFCNHCRSKIKYFNYPICFVCRYPSINGATHFRCLRQFYLDGIYLGAHYSGSIRKAIHLIKYRFVSDAVKELTDILFIKYPSLLKEFDFLFPIPLHSKKLKERGFNQALLIANNIAKKLNIPVNDKILSRSKYTKPQFGLKVNERKLNVKNVFQVANSQVIKNKKICLIDDVATTFSTLNECAKILKKEGANKVWAIVLAHGN